MTARTPATRWLTRGATAASALLALAGGTQVTASAAPAPAHRPAGLVADPYSPAAGHPYRRGAVPTRGAAARMRHWAAGRPATFAAAATSGPANDLAYGGGVDGIGVTSRHEKVYLVFYGSQWGRRHIDANGDVTLSGDPSREAPYLQELFKGLGTDGETWSGVMTQYCQGVTTGATSCPGNSTEHVSYPAGGALAGVWVDERAPSPRKATGRQLGLAAVAAARHFGNTTAAANRDAQYFLLSPTGANPDGWLSAGFCAWHDYTGDPRLPGGPVTSPYGDLAFTNLPYQTDQGGSCGQNYVNAGHGGRLDGVSIVAGHEYAETITDQNPDGGWTDSGGYENGDKCIWIPAGANGGAFDLHTRTGSFAMQTTWANDAPGGKGGCLASHKVIGNGNAVSFAVPATQHPRTGSPVSLRMKAYDSDPGQRLTFSATGLPPGLSVGPGSGVISGAPAAAGSYSCVVEATDATGMSAWATFTWAVRGQLLRNPGFETGSLSPWQATAGVLRRRTSAYPAHSGSWLARLDGRGRPHTDTLSQSVTVPAAASSARLSFWLEVESNDPRSSAYDHLAVEVVSAGGKVLTKLRSYSNRSRRGRYLHHSLSLRAFAGRRVTVRFVGSQTLLHHDTAFLVDDVALHVS